MSVEEIDECPGLGRRARRRIVDFDSPGNEEAAQRNLHGATHHQHAAVGKHRGRVASPRDGHRTRRCRDARRRIVDLGVAHFSRRTTAQPAGQQHATVREQRCGVVLARDGDVARDDPSAARRIVDLERGRERAAGDEHAPIGQRRRGVSAPLGMETRTRTPALGPRVVELRAGERRNRLGTARDQDAAVAEERRAVPRAGELEGWRRLKAGRRRDAVRQAAVRRRPRVPS